MTVLKAAKSCFSNLVEVTGIVLARDETTVRPERAGLKVAEVLADAGDTVTAGQTLARLSLPEGGTAQVAAPVAGLIASSSAVVGAMASAKGEALTFVSPEDEGDLRQIERDLGKGTIERRKLDGFDYTATEPVAARTSRQPAAPRGASRPRSSRTYGGARPQRRA